jgi:uncharacterized protein (DUF305 family)
MRTLTRAAASIAYRPAAAALTIAIAVLLLCTAYAVGGWRAGAQFPDDSSVEAGFARDMSVHHAQAVTLAMLAYRRATQPTVRELAHDILLSQQREIGVMDGWLQQW